MQPDEASGMMRLRRIRGLGFVTIPIERGVISVPRVTQCPNGGIRVNGVCQPGSVGPVYSGTGPVVIPFPVQSNPAVVPSPGFLGPPIEAPPAPEPFVPPVSTPITVNTPAGPVAVATDPSTGQQVTSIPPSGPLPPGNCYQQMEEPGSLFPYVFIGGPGCSEDQCPTGYYWDGSQCMSLYPSTSPGGYGYYGTSYGNDPNYPNWEQQNPPAGSYQQSCSNIQSDGIGDLWAECQDTSGRFLPASLNYSQCVSAPYNQDGVLGCGGPSGRQIFTPAGGTPPAGPYGSYNYESAYGTLPTTGAVWSPYSQYYAGQTVSYQGLTWIAESAPPAGLAPGSDGGVYWKETGTALTYSYSNAYNPLYSYGSTAVAPVTQTTAATSSITAWFDAYKWWILGGLAAVIVLPRILPRH